jgi:hypothetical protein
MGCVMVNTALMAATHYGQTDAFVANIERAELLLFSIYVIEMLLKWLGLGMREYFTGQEKGFNRLDFTLVSMAALDYLANLFFSAEKMKGFAIGTRAFPVSIPLQRWLSYP